LAFDGVLHMAVFYIRWCSTYGGLFTCGDVLHMAVFTCGSVLHMAVFLHAAVVSVFVMNCLFRMVK